MWSEPVMERRKGVSCKKNLRLHHSSSKNVLIEMELMYQSSTIVLYLFLFIG
jgi:hypothetical protein